MTKKLKKINKSDYRILKDMYETIAQGTTWDCFFNDPIQKFVLKKLYPECIRGDKFAYSKVDIKKYPDAYIQHLIEEIEYHSELSSKLLYDLGALYNKY
jgi:hypothetical protein